MSAGNPAIGSNPTNFLNGLVRSFETQHFNLNTDLKVKMECYVEVIEAKKRELQESPCPDVKYKKKATGCVACFCHFICKKMFSDWSCCQRAVCCGRETVYNIKVENEDNLVRLTPGKAQTDKQNQLTNASFLLELYNTYGNEYLPIVYVCAIDCIQRLFPAQLEYWKQWDPSSETPLEKSKARFFRGLMEDAYVVLRNARLDLMKRDLQTNLARVSRADLVDFGEARNLFTPISGNDRVQVSVSPHTVEKATNTTPPKESSSPPSVAAALPLGQQEMSVALKPVTLVVDDDDVVMLAPPVETPQAALLKVFDVTSPKESSSPPSVAAALSLGQQEMSVALKPATFVVDDDDDVVMLAPSVETPQAALLKVFDVTPKDSLNIVKGVRIGSTMVDFNPQKIIDDLLLMTKCTEEQAKIIAVAVEAKLEFPCRRQDIWNAIKREIREARIEIKETVNMELAEAVLSIVESVECLRFSDIPLDKIPVSKFTDLIINAKRSQIDRAKKSRSVKTTAIAVSVLRPSTNQHSLDQPVLVSMVTSPSSERRDVSDESLTRGLEQLALENPVALGNLGESKVTYV